MDNRTRFLSQIKRHISSLVVDYRTHILSSRTIVKICEELLNQTFGYELTELTTKNDASIVLSDESRAIAVAVATDNTKYSLDQIVSAFIRGSKGSRLCDKFQILIILVLTDSAVVSYNPSYFQYISTADTKHPTVDGMSLKNLTDHISNLEDAQVEDIANFLLNTLGESNILPIAPEPSPFFVSGSRSQECQKIFDLFNTENVVFICGAEGNGKTQLALQYAKTHIHKENAFFLPFVTPLGSKEELLFETIHQIPLTHAPIIGDDQSSSKDMFQARLAFLRNEHKGALLIIDNLTISNDDAGNIWTNASLQALANTGLKILITTQQQIPGSSITVSPLSEDALLLLIKSYHADIQYPADQLQVFVNEIRSSVSVRTIAQLSSLMHYMGAILPLEGLPEPPTFETPQAPTAMAIVELFQRPIESLAPQQQNVLSLTFLLPETGLYTPLFLYCLTNDLRSAVKGLVETGWLIQENGNTFMHPFITIACQKYLPCFAESVDTFLDNLLLFDRSIFWSKLTTAQQKEIYLQIAQTLANASQNAVDDNGLIARRCAAFWKLTNRFTAALQWELRSIEICQKSMKQDVWELAYSNHLAGECYHHLGRIKQSHEFWCHTLNMCENQLGVSAPDLAAAYYQVGRSEMLLGNLARAKQHLDKALALISSVYRTTADDSTERTQAHPLGAAIELSLATLADKQEQHVAALQHQTKALFSRHKLVEQIQGHLSILMAHTMQDNMVSLVDINTSAVDFYCKLLNIVLGVYLKNLNLLNTNFPTIDLADEVARLCVQITTLGGREKIDYTLKLFFQQELDKHYDRLIVLIIGSNKVFSRPFRTERGFDFNPERDIWDISRLLVEIERLDDAHLKSVADYLQREIDIPRMDSPQLNLPLQTSLAPEMFIGRKQELAAIQNQLETSHIAILSGMGGTGKTELAIQYGHQYRRKGHGHVYFVTFRHDFRRTLIERVAPALPRLSKGSSDEDIVFQTALVALQRCSTSDLLILDNVDLEEESFLQLRRELSVLPMRILITSRAEDLNSIIVHNLRRDELHQLFSQYAVDISTQEMDKLIDAVGSHTLTVDLIARSLKQSRRKITADQFLKALQMQDLSGIPSEKNRTSYKNEVHQEQISAHLRAVFRVAQMSESECEIMRYATLLPPNGMSIELFLAPFGRDSNADHTLDSLLGKGWIIFKDDMISIHPVIRLVCCEELKPTDDNCGIFLRKIWRQHDERTYDKERLQQLADLYSSASNLLEDRLGEWAFYAGTLWDKLGESQKALMHNLYMMEKGEENLPADDPNLALAYNNVSGSYSMLGDYNKALEYGLKSLAIREKVLEENDPARAESYNNLSGIFGALGDYPTALEYGQKALAIRTKATTNELDIAVSYNNVGGIYGQLGDHEQELKYYLRALSIRQEHLLSNHPDLALAYNNVGSTYSDLGDNLKALEYQMKALSIREEALPPNHPDLAQSYNNLATTYSALGDYKKAMEYGLKSLVILEKVLPPDHPHLAIGYSNVAHLYGQIGEYSKALEYSLKAMDIQQRRLAPNHPDLARSFTHVGYIYHALGDYSKAMDYHCKALAIREQVFPENHPILAQSYSNISHIHTELGSFSKALEFQQQALRILQHTLPPEHPDIAKSNQDLSRIYVKVGNKNKALEYAKKSMDILTKILPADHLDLMHAYINMGFINSSMGKRRQAIKHLKQALTIAEKNLPPEHPQLTSLKNAISRLQKE